MNYSPESQEALNDLRRLSATLEQLEKLAEDNPYALFLPHAKQQAALNNNSKEQWLLGGNRSGKTEYMIASAVGQITGQLPSRPLAARRGGWVIYIVSQTKPKQREVVQEKILRYLPMKYIKQNKRGQPIIYQSKGIWDYIELVDPALNDPHLVKYPRKNLHGCKLYFKSYEEGTTGFEGSSVDAAYCDEEPPESIYEAIDARLLDRKKYGNGWFVCAMTPDPDNGLTWTYDEIVEKDGENPDRFLLYMSTYDNKENIGEEEIAKLEKKYKGSTAKARIYGLHVSREGYVLDKLRPYPAPDGNIIHSFKPDWRFYTPYESTDWGYKHPWHWGFYAVSKDGEIIKYAELHLERTSTPTMKAAVRRMRLKYGYKQPMLTVGDPSMARKESDQLSILDKLALGMDMEYDGSGRSEYERGRNVWTGQGEPPEDRTHPDYIAYPIVIKPANNDRDEGWRLLNERFEFEPGIGKPGWYYTENCKESIKEAKNLQYPPDKDQKRVNKVKEIARKRKDDAPDADRYMSNEDPVFVDDYDPEEDWLLDDIDEDKPRFKDQKRRKDAKVGEYKDGTTGY